MFKSHENTYIPSWNHACTCIDSKLCTFILLSNENNDFTIVIFLKCSKKRIFSFRFWTPVAANGFNVFHVISQGIIYNMNNFVANICRFSFYFKHFWGIVVFCSVFFLNWKMHFWMTTEKTRTYAKLDLKSGAPKVYASSVDRIVCNVLPCS